MVTLHLAPFILLVLGISMAIQSWSLPYFGALRDQVDGRLVSVDPEGPAAQSGLRLGDNLLAIDGVPVNRRNPLWGNKRAGQAVDVRFRRAGQSHTALVRLAPLPLKEQALQLSLYLIAFTLWLAGTAVLFLRPRQPAARRFCLQSLGAGTLLTLLPLNFAQVGWAMRLSGVAAVWTPTLLIDLHTLFPLALDSPGVDPSANSATIPRWRRWLLSPVYALCSVLTLVYLAWDPATRMSSIWGLWLSNVVLLYFLAAVLIAAALLARAYRHAPTTTVRRRVRLVLAGTILALIPPCLLLFVPMLMGRPPLVPESVALLSLVLIPLAYAYGIYRHNLMGIDFLVNRVAVYLTLGLLLLTMYFAVALVIVALTDVAALLAGALASLVAMAFVSPLRQGIDLAWERVFYPDVYGYRGVVEAMSQRLSETLDIDHLGRLLVHDLSDAMDLEGAALLLTRGTSLVLHETMGTLRILDGLEEAPPSVEGAVARYLVQVEMPVSGDTLSQVARDATIHSLLPETRLCVPLVLAGELQGVLLLGAKRTDEFFSPRDRRLLSTLARQAALAVKNVRLVAELRARMAEIAQDRRELQQAYRHLTRSREDERRRLAAELHEDVIQGLTVVTFDVSHYASVIGGDMGHELLALNSRISERVRDIRRICAGLWPRVLDMGLAPALRSHLRAYRDATGLEVELEHGAVSGLPDDVQISLFRMTQEALNNVRKHAQARSVCVYLASTPEAWELSVVDDGVGFDVPTATASRGDHFGLRIMREYIEAVGGQLTLRSRRGQGTTVIARVPRSLESGSQPATIHSQTADQDGVSNGVRSNTEGGQES